MIKMACGVPPKAGWTSVSLSVPILVVIKSTDKVAPPVKGAPGMTALFMLTWSCDTRDVIPAAELLIANGADVNARAGVLGKPLKQAKKCDDKRLYNLLLQHGSKK